MKKLTTFFSVFLLSIFNALGQKNLEEMNLISPYLERVSIDEIRDFEAYQKEHFQNPRGAYMSRTFRIIETENVQFFRLIGTKDIIRVLFVLNDEAENNWEEYVKGRSSVFSVGQESTIEFIDFEDGRGAILHLMDPLSLGDTFFYNNKTAGVSLLLTYISNEDADTRVRNMKNILKSLKVGANLF